MISSPLLHIRGLYVIDPQKTHKKPTFLELSRDHIVTLKTGNTDMASNIDAYLYDE